MIYRSKKYQLKDFDKQIKKCLAYVESDKLLEKTPGRYEIDGKNLFVTVVYYETSPVEIKVWEAHKKYIDVHYVLDGKERIDINFIDNMVQGTYNEKDDCMLLEGDKSSSVIISSGEYVVCFPEDAHIPGIRVDQSSTVKKAIFKILINSFNEEQSSCTT